MILATFEKMWMSERAGLAKVPRWNHLWFQTSWLHRNVSARAPDTSYRQQHNTDGKDSCTRHRQRCMQLLKPLILFHLSSKDASQSGAIQLDDF